jgi:cell division septation protein DedD
MRTAAKRGLEFIAGLLETRTSTYVAALLCLGLAGVSWLGIQQRQTPHPVVAATAPLLADTSVFLERAPVAEPATLEQAYIVRVGSFRDPANAARIVESLRERALNVRTAELAGLYIVELGPFSLRSDAEDSAQELRRAGGLSPQIFRQK